MKLINIKPYKPGKQKKVSIPNNAQVFYEDHVYLFEDSKGNLVLTKKDNVELPICDKCGKIKLSDRCSCE